MLHEVSFAAQNVPPGIVQQIDPGRTGEELTPTMPPPTTIAPEQIEIPDQEPIKLKNKKKIFFILGGVKVVGNHVFTTKQLEQFYIDLIGTEVSIDDVKKIASDITSFIAIPGTF